MYLVQSSDAVMVFSGAIDRLSWWLLVSVQSTGGIWFTLKEISHYRRKGFIQTLLHSEKWNFVHLFWPSIFYHKVCFRRRILC